MNRPGDDSISLVGLTAQKTVVITPSEIGRGVGERTLLELLKLGIALLIAVFGLVSGAQGQIARLDVLPGIIAVFLVGFTLQSIAPFAAKLKRPRKFSADQVIAVVS